MFIYLLLAKPVSEILEEYGLYEFLTLFEDANLTLEADSLENVTFFIPANEVMQVSNFIIILCSKFLNKILCKLFS